MVAAQLIEFGLAGRAAFAQTQQAVGELLAARHWARTNGTVNVSLAKYGADAHRASPFQVAQEAASVGGGSWSCRCG